MIRALAVDPGKVTGFVVVDMEVGPGQVITTRVDRWGELEKQEFLDLTWNLLTTTGEHHHFFHVIVEKFIYRPGRPLTPQYDHSEIQGTVRWMTMFNGLRFHTQLVSDAKKYGTRERLEPYRKNKGVGFRGNGHALMALSHALLFSETAWEGT